ncbi:MAG TPA: DNA repair protein RadC [Parvibaculum sp.]|jgi:DNA repair protein RadC
MPEGAANISVIQTSIRSRLLTGETESLTDHELLETLLAFATRGGKSSKRHAQQLIRRFGTLGDIISEDTGLLLETSNMDEQAVLLFRLVQSIAIHLAREQMPQRTIISSTDALLAYCKAHLSRLRVERFQLFFLDNRNALIAAEIQGRGTVDHVPVYPREIVKRALALNASSIILVHNHPSGDPTPSLADIQMTEKIVSIAAPLGIQILDHIIIGRTRHLSFKAHKFF